jgi:hypothetical protein
LAVAVEKEKETELLKWPAAGDLDAEKKAAVRDGRLTVKIFVSWIFIEFLVF